MGSEQQYIELYQEARQMIISHAPEHMNAIRDKAFEHFKAQGFPTRRVERYKYTDLQQLFEPNYGLNLNRLNIPVDPYEAFRCDVPNLSTSLYFMVNDAFYTQEAPKGHLPEGVFVGSMKEHPELNMHFSISCTTRAPRGTEQNGVEYFFISPAEFKEKIAQDAFVEYEEVYTDKYYGTLKSQVTEMTENGQNVVFDIDVKGGCNIKRQYGNKALSIFIQPPSIEELRRRLEGRATDAQEVIEQRLSKASYELTFADKFDIVIVNDDLEKAKADTLNAINEFLNK